jgi:membrane protein implicated in regulation of membrane protease activity
MGAMAFFFWGLLALGLAGALVFSSQLEFLVPAVASVLVLAVALVPGLTDNYLVQTLLWLALSAGGLLVFRNRLRSLKFGPRKAVEDPVAGKSAVVVEAIGEDGEGRIRFGGTTWKAVSAEPVAVGTVVTVLGQDGLVFQVERPADDRVEEEFRALAQKSNPKEM